MPRKRGIEGFRGRDGIVFNDISVIIGDFEDFHYGDTVKKRVHEEGFDGTGFRDLVNFPLPGGIFWQINSNFWDFVGKV